MNLDISVQSSGGSWQIDVTMDDPTRNYPKPTLPPSSPVSVFASSARAGGFVGSGVGNAIRAITQPIAAWRLTSNSGVVGGTITATVLQQGIG